ncbi:NTP transferase domain-containing protein [bacterium]|nr:NTP transferase domain-containing protein [bacterium]
MQRTLGVILGGGPGSRLYPLTKYRSKPAVPFGGMCRLIDVPLSNCLNSGLDRIFVLTQYNSASLNRHVSLAYKFDSLREGFVSVLAAEQAPDHSDWYQGSADAVRMNLRHFDPYKANDILILRGDHIYRMDYRTMVSLHRRQRADITIACLPVQADKAKHYNILKMNSEGRITDYHKPLTDSDDAKEWALSPGLFGGAASVGDGPIFLASMGIYLFRRNVLREILTEQDDKHFEQEIIPYAIKNVRTFGFPFSDYWEDIDSVRAYFNVNQALTVPEPKYDFFDPLLRVFSHPRFLPGSYVEHVESHRSIICQGCRIEKAKLERTIVGDGSILRGDVELKETILIGADYYETDSEIRENAYLKRPDIGIGGDTHIRRAIIDKNARIGEGVRIDPGDNMPDTDGDGWAARDGIIVVEKDAVIPDGTILP